MVGFEPNNSGTISATEHALAGAVSGTVTRALCQPLDVLKIRFQLQVDPISQTRMSKYWGLMDACGKIWQQEGWRAFWKGHVPAQGLSIAYGIAQYTSFEFFTKLVWTYLPENLTTVYRPFTHTVCGSLAGVAATVVAHPADVLRTRFVGQGEPKVYHTLGAACSSILKQEGFHGFYKGLAPALSQIAPQMGLQFGLYSLFTTLWDSSSSLGASSSLVCGSGAGLVSKLIVYPLDVVKKRLQIQGFQKGRQQFGTFHVYSGLSHCCARVWKTEGIRGLYKGLCPSLLKAATTAGCNFYVYDHVLNVLSMRNR